MKRICLTIIFALFIATCNISSPAYADTAEIKQETMLPSASAEYNITMNGQKTVVGYNIDAKALISEFDDQRYLFEIDFSNTTFYNTSNSPLEARIYPMYIKNDSNHRTSVILNKGINGPTELTSLDSLAFNDAKSLAARCGKIDEGKSTSNKYKFENASIAIPKDLVKYVCENIVWVVVFSDTEASYYNYSTDTLQLVRNKFNGSDEFGSYYEKTTSDGVVLNDPFEAMGNSVNFVNEMNGDSKEIKFTPRFGGKSVNIRLDGDLGKLFMGSDYASIKAMCSVLAASESGYDEVTPYLKDILGFDDCYYYDRSDDSETVKQLQKEGKDIDLASYWIAHKTLDDGSVLILIFARGTDGDLQWKSQGDKWTATGIGDSRVKSFKLAADEMDASAAQYMKDRNLTNKKVSFSLGGYSRGAGVTNNLAARNTIGGIPVNDDNCNAITFATPNTIVSNPFPQHDNGKNRILNIIRVEDLVPNVPPLGTKHGTTINDGVDGDHYEEIYGAKPNYRAEVGDMANFKNHFAELYIAEIMSKEPKNSNDWRPILGFSEYCSTDVKIFKNDELVASCMNGEVWSDEIPLIFVNSDNEKEIYLPSNGEYRVITEATGDGTMQVGAILAPLDGESENTTISEIETYNITAGEVYELNQTTGKPMLLDKSEIASLDSLENSAPDGLNNSYTGEKRNGLNRDTILIIVLATVVILTAIVLMIVLTAKKRKRARALSRPMPVAPVPPAPTDGFILHLITRGYRVPLVPRAVIYQCQIDESYIGRTKQAGLVRTKQNAPSDIGIKNVSDYVWYVTRPGEEMKPIMPGSTVKIVRGTKITIGNNTVEVM